MVRRCAPFVGLALLASAWCSCVAQDDGSNQITHQIAAMQKEQAEMLRKLKSLEDQLAKLKEQQSKKEEAAKKMPAAVTSGFGKVRAGGLMQQWLVGASGGGVNSSARIRRMELKFAGDMRPDLQWTVMVDPAKPLSLNTTALEGVTVATSVNPRSNMVQDAFMTFVANPHLSIDLGQQRVPLGMAALRPSSQLLTVERPLMNSLPIANGFTGDSRDVGIQIRGTYPRVDYTLAVLNDTGLLQNDVENNNRKDVVGRVVFRGLPYSHLGLSGTLRTDSTGASKIPRKRFGAELAVNHGAHTLEWEYGRALDAPAGTAVRSEGGYLSYAYRVSPAVHLIARGDLWDPGLGLANDKEHDYTVGANWYLSGNNAKVQFNLVRKQIQAGAPAFLGLSRTLFMTAFQTAW